ncbi:hypothetical protein Ppb6_04151 [Photorhabdus australis subsp. thailandensis]|uniref:DUF7823 domain-containing protein n=1 Tax=Photorhabdus australis subsp. thailandensis TaxID=2805096 RepID=A0A1C0TYB9_9GAMM|nr:hypothetical protein [Photorhabdus australis]OCQ50662.1 hypothetical protein Ppb6_04151 [Photorhabdus australis subsp. thailandensis]
MAYDWSLLKSDDNMMVFDITLGTGEVIDETGTAWGYLSTESLGNNEFKTYYGSLNLIQNKTSIKENLIFHWIENNDNTFRFVWNVYTYEDEENYQKVEELFKSKSLYITVYGVTYNLGERSSTIKRNEYRCVNWYENSTETQKSGAILKKTGETKRFYCNWR